MRRKDRDISERNARLDILNRCDCVRIAFAVNNEPYIVAMSFGYIWDDTLRLYLHSAREGKKIDMMRTNNRVCFQMDTDHELVTDELSCRWGMRYAGIVGRGTLTEVIGEEERILGLERLMANYGRKETNRFAAEILQATMVLRLDVTEFSAKRRAT
jgi:nitroimidazol reductase NimA-like FMN-containing flavoprotein (pyridoxamine 5'-phosphate oxidase superfamily)